MHYTFTPLSNINYISVKLHIVLKKWRGKKTNPKPNTYMMFLFPPDLPIKLMPIQGNMLGDDSPAILIRPAYVCSFCHAVSAPGPGGAPPQPAWCWWNPSAGVCLQTQLSQSSCFTKLSYTASSQWMPVPWDVHIPPVWIMLLGLVSGHQGKQGDNKVMLSHTARKLPHLQCHLGTAHLQHKVRAPFEGTIQPSFHF